MQSGDFGNFLTAVLVYQVSCVAGGCFLGYLGYRLYVKGIYTKESDLSARFQGFHLTLARVGPGTLFALFGVALAALGIFRQPQFKSIDTPTDRTIWAQPEMVAPKTNLPLGSAAPSQTPK